MSITLLFILYLISAFYLLTPCLITLLFVALLQIILFYETSIKY